MNDPGFRAVNFRQLRQAYRDQVLALLEGGVDMLLVETIFEDVYKRQLYAQNYAYTAEEMPPEDATFLAPVSYTHLDV